MTLHDFAALVAAMRHSQKEYFRTRSDAALDASKRAERQVDEALKRIADANSGQKELFE